MNTPEYQIIPNPALGSMAIWHFVSAYEEAHPNRCASPLPITMCVLPVVFHKESVDLLCRRRFEGGLLNAKAEDRTFGVGLQERMLDMVEISFASLNVGIATSLIAIVEESMTVLPGSLSPNSFRGGANVSRIIQTSRRLGYWFATRPLVETCSLLRISF